jgi:hypothetical protein
MFVSKHDHTSLICDIGCATVSASFVRFSQKTKPAILASVSLPLSINEVSLDANLEAKVMSLLEKAITLLVSQEIPKLGSAVIKEKNVDYAQVVLSSRWYISKLANITISKDKSFKLDESTLHDTLNEQERIFEEEALSGVYQPLTGVDIHMIEREVLAVSLNGYDAPNPYDKLTRYAELSLYMSLVQQKFLKKVSEIVKKHFHIHEIQFHTSPLVFFRTIPLLFPHENEALLVEVSGESTQVSFVVHNSIVESNNFSNGRNTTLRDIMNKLGVTQEIAISSVRLSEVGTLDKDAETNLQNVLLNDATNWNKELTDILNKEKDHVIVPAVCFLVCDEDVSGIFQKRLKDVGASFGISHIIPVTATLLNTHVTVGKFVVASDASLLHALYLTSRDFH